MGQDIHQRIYLKLKDRDEYVNAHEICDWCPTDSAMFGEIVEGRNYSVFSLFGSSRGEYSQLDYAHYGLPDFLREKTFDRFSIEIGYYGFIWFKLPEFVKAVEEYVEKLQDPLKYLDEDADERKDWAELKTYAETGRKDWYEKFLKSYREWLDYHEKILNFLKKVKIRLEAFDAADGWRGSYGKMFDLKETVFLFFFDS